MQVFGLDPFVASIFITIIGVTASVVLGWLKGSDPFNPRQVAASAIIAFVVSYQIVAATVQQIPDGADNLTAGIIVMGLIAGVSGIDSLAKSATQAATKARALRAK